ncbi:fructosamine kinase family protein [Gammaproteobacteria bacterium AB-CW1]|uniref:Fructosamine kinase family protein n=1 Tax=Natronospira elongata TaxID=3110268 RepID=A0AAP6JED6_9GAMM|nr:fructosamine kinase family protein [Gammaproteobacteria bacterium AB-CW1]
MPEPSESQRQAIFRAAGLPETRIHCRPLSGGDIGHAWQLDSEDQSFFLKTLPASNNPMLAAEADGLARLAATDAVRVPTVLAQGRDRHIAWLLCEYLPLSAPSEASDTRLGEALAALHGHQAEHHGLERDNYIGLTPQPNRQSQDWCWFFREQRLRPQLDWAAAKGAGGALQEAGERLLEALPRLLADHRPAPSLLHGDLWVGNRARIGADEPVIFDPACHYGDRECDLAMSELFGRFHAGFYQAYQHHYPLDPGYHHLRRPLYQLYHVLNHCNLFGSPYDHHALSLVETVLNAD